MTRRYAPWLSLLARDSDYIRRAPAPSYWALSPYYAAQFNDCSCSLATAAMLVNAVRGSAGLAAGEMLVTQDALLAAVNSKEWVAGVGQDGGRGATLAMMGPLLAQGFAAYGIHGVTVEAVSVFKDGADALARFRADLRAIEASSATMLAVNYYVGPVLGYGDYGHFSPVGAYDESRDRVLILDVDRGWFEPYWVPAERLLDGMSIAGMDGARRGYLRIALNRPSA